LNKTFSLQKLAVYFDPDPEPNPDVFEMQDPDQYKKPVRIRNDYIASMSTFSPSTWQRKETFFLLEAPYQRKEFGYLSYMVAFLRTGKSSL
jgi:hypothetical protein